jgi:hypothetical protein
MSETCSHPAPLLSNNWPPMLWKLLAEFRLHDPDVASLEQRSFSQRTRTSPIFWNPFLSSLRSSIESSYTPFTLLTPGEADLLWFFLCLIFSHRHCG